VASFSRLGGARTRRRPDRGDVSNPKEAPERARSHRAPERTVLARLGRTRATEHHSVFEAGSAHAASLRRGSRVCTRLRNGSPRPRRLASTLTLLALTVSGRTREDPSRWRRRSWLAPRTVPLLLTFRAARSCARRSLEQRLLVLRLAALHPGPPAHPSGLPASPLRRLSNPSSTSSATGRPVPHAPCRCHATQSRSTLVVLSPPRRLAPTNPRRGLAPGSGHGVRDVLGPSPPLDDDDASPPPRSRPSEGLLPLASRDRVTEHHPKASLVHRAPLPSCRYAVARDFRALLRPTIRLRSPLLRMATRARSSHGFCFVWGPPATGRPDASSPKARGGQPARRLASAHPRFARRRALDRAGSPSADATLVHASRRRYRPLLTRPRAFRPLTEGPRSHRDAVAGCSRLQGVAPKSDTRHTKLRRQRTPEGVPLGRHRVRPRHLQDRSAAAVPRAWPAKTLLGSRGYRQRHAYEDPACTDKRQQRYLYSYIKSIGMHMPMRSRGTVTRDPW
jgi:hypothetical protein